MRQITTVGFDADDTLWQNESFFRLTQDRFARLLESHADPAHLSRRLEDAERRNLRRYGFGIKGFVLSMVETALDVTGDKVPASVIRGIIEAGHEMLAHPVDLMPGAAEAVDRVAATHRVLLITKGDLLDQERKLAQSGLGEKFAAVEIVSDKSPEVYRRIFEQHGEGAPHAAMVGNSLKSDVLPAIAVGAVGILVPAGLGWALDHADPPEDACRFHRIPDLSHLPELVERLA